MMACGLTAVLASSVVDDSGASPSFRMVLVVGRRPQATKWIQSYETSFWIEVVASCHALITVSDLSIRPSISLH